MVSELNFGFNFNNSAKPLSVVQIIVKQRQDTAFLICINTIEFTERENVIKTTFASLAAPKFVILTTFGPASGENVIKVTIFSFQCWFVFQSVCKCVYIVLTHWGLGMNTSDFFCHGYQLDACSQPSHYLNQCCSLDLQEHISIKF